MGDHVLYTVTCISPGALSKKYSHLVTRKFRMGFESEGREGRAKQRGHRPATNFSKQGKEINHMLIAHREQICRAVLGHEG